MDATPAPEAVDLARFIRPGDTIIWGQSHAEPRTLIGRLVAQRHRFARVRVFPGIGLSGQLRPEHADAIDFLCYSGGGTTRALAEAGVLDVLPVHYSRFPHLMRSGRFRVDVAMLQLPPPDATGRFSLGMAREYLAAAVARARVLIGEIHPDVPWTHGGPYLTRDDFALLIDSDAPLPADAAPRVGPVEDAIGLHVAALVPDGATLQTGIGSIPDAVTRHLARHRDLGVHTGSIGGGVAALQEAGVVTNARKPIDPGVTVGGVLIGGSRLRRFAHRNRALALRGTEYTHDPAVLARLPRFVAVNSAVEVDLTGQVNAELARGTYVGAVGGIIDFLRAAGTSDGGVPVIALPSTAGGASRIVARLSGPVSVPRADSCVMVTEHGIADLRGLTLAERIPRMIAIAHPGHREALAREARDRGPLG
jgi:acetyl-CoA hydrolase